MHSYQPLLEIMLAEKAIAGNNTAYKLINATNNQCDTAISKLITLKMSRYNAVDTDAAT